MTEQQQQKTLLYTKNEIPEREIRETISFSIASNRIKYQYSYLENPRAEEPGRLQPMGLHRVTHN